jgi:hypothetical protein
MLRLATAHTFSLTQHQLTKHGTAIVHLATAPPSRLFPAHAYALLLLWPLAGCWCPAGSWFLGMIELVCTVQMH